MISALGKAIHEGSLHHLYHVVLDEAYPCRGQELSPYRGKELSERQDTFNYYLSLHRQVVERAFGLLVARWGIYWRPLRVEFKHIPLIISVTCKLHNICVDRFGQEHVEPYIGGMRDMDYQPGDILNVDQFTEAIEAVGQGFRADLQARDCLLREKLANQLQNDRRRRPRK